MRRRLLLLSACFVLVVAACGDSGGDTPTTDDTDATATTEADATTTTEAEATTTTAEEGRDAVVAAVKEGILESAGGDDGFAISDGEAQCVAEDVVDALGVGGVVELGLSVDDAEGDPFANATDEQIGQVVDAMLDCVDFRTALLPEIAGDGISDESAGCVVDGMLAADFFRPALIDSLGSGGDVAFEDDPEAAGAMIEIVLECLTPEELAELGSDG